MMGHARIPVRRRLTSFSLLNPYQMDTPAEPGLAGGNKLKNRRWSEEEVATKEAAVPRKEMTLIIE